MATSNFLLLAMSAFWLGTCPFSLWIGKWLLARDIRNYSDGNPGAANVFRGGGRKSGALALILDVGKGIPFVWLAGSLFGSGIEVTVVALSAILGSAFSPLLGFKGGKSIAITFGTLFALPEHDIAIIFMILILLGFLLIEVDAWTVMVAPIGSLAYFLVTTGSSWQSAYMAGVVVILAVKHFADLQTVPRFGNRLIDWVQSRRRGT